MPGRRARGLFSCGFSRRAASASTVLAACVDDQPNAAAGDAGVEGGDLNDGSIADADAGPRATVEEVAVGNGFACAVLSDHTVMCWGRNDLGQSAQPTASGCHFGDGVPLMRS